MKYDCGGYATKANLRCSDGRTIKKDAFVDQDGATVPLVWQHQHNSPENVLGHAVLENREDGVYAYCKFNETPNGEIAKSLVAHGDLNSFSIHANQLVQRGSDVLHGVIREVSLVLAGANPGAKIDNCWIQHSDGTDIELDDEAIIQANEIFQLDVEFSHADSENQNGGKEMAKENQSEGKTVKEVFETLTEEQKNAVYAMLGYALQHSDEDDDEEDDEDLDDEDLDDEDDEDDDDIEHSEGGNIVKKNVFEGAETSDNSLSHDEMMAIISDGKKFGSLKDSFLEHGITDIDILFPEAKAVRATPDLITRQMDWVSKVWNATSKSPFSRIKSMAANLTADEARAKGYIKGKKKVEEQFGLLKRVTTPQTVYKKQKLDRDDVIDIVDMDVVAWMKAEMRMMLNEELARAILVGDGRPASSDDKINPINIRPIYQDDDMYTIHYPVEFPTNADTTDKANAIIDAAHMARIDYKGSGTPVMLTDSKTLTTMLLARDKIGHRLYNTTAELASALRVSEIIEVPVLENTSRTVGTGKDAKEYELIGLILNLKDYTIGADRGGAVSMFDDFDIDYNQMKYLIETRCSGALTLPYSAIALEMEKPADTEAAG